MSYEDADRKKVVQGFLWNIFGRIAEATNGIYLYAARYLLGGEALGVFVIAFAFVELLNRFLIGGFGDAATLFVSRALHGEGGDDEGAQDSAARERALYGSLATCLVVPTLVALLFVLLIALGSQLIYSAFWSQHDKVLPRLLVALSFMLPLSVWVRVPVEAVKAHLDMRWAVWIVSTLLPLANVALALAFYLMGFGVWSLVVGQLSAHALAVFGSLFALSRYFSLRRLVVAILGRPWRRDVLRFAFPQSVNMLMNFGLSRTDTLMLSAFVDSNPVGIYALVSELAITIRSAKTSFSSVFAPLVAKYKGQGNTAGIRDALVSVSYWTTTLSFPILLGVVLFHSDLILGPGKPWTESPWLVWLLCLGPMLSCLWGLSGNLLLMTGHSLVLLLNSSLLMGFNVALNLLFIPRWGLLGAASATAISSLIVSVVQVVEMWRLERIRFDYGQSLQLIVLGTVAVLPAAYLSHISGFGELSWPWQLGAKLGLWLAGVLLGGVALLAWPGKSALRRRLRRRSAP